MKPSERIEEIQRERIEWTRRKGMKTDELYLLMWSVIDYLDELQEKGVIK